MGGGFASLGVGSAADEEPLVHRSSGRYHAERPETAMDIEGGGGAASSKSKGVDFPTHIVNACFVATFAFYVERTGFPVIFTRVAKEVGVNELQKGSILSAFYYGYALSQIPASAVAFKLGGHVTLAFAFLCWSTLCVITPAIMTHLGALAVVRVLVGIAQGCVIPSIHSILAATMGPGDKSKGVSFVTSGMYLGSSVAFLVVPSLLRVYGPGSSGVSLGLLGFSWLMVWVAMKGHVTQTQRRVAQTISHGARSAPPKSIKWMTMLGETAVWAIVVNNFVFHYSIYVIMNWLPTYFEQMLQTPLTNLGLAKVLPYLTMFFTSNVGGVFGEWMVMKKGVSVRNTRVLVNSLGLALSAATIYCMSVATTTHAGLTMATMSLAFLGFARAGFAVNHMDIAPEYAGVIMAISNTAGTVAGIIGVSFTGYILDSFGGAKETVGWKYAYGTASLLNLLGLIIFIVYCKGHKIFQR